MGESSIEMMFSGEWNPGTQSGRTTLRSCNRRNTNNVISMEKDGSKIDVIIVDAPECSSRRSRQSRASLKPNKKCFPNRVIIIDEENGDYFGSENGNQNTMGNNGYHFSSSESQFPVDSDSDECQVLKGNVCVDPPRWMFSDHAVCSDSLSDSDSNTDIEIDTDSECEIMDDLNGSIRKEWEKAYLMKKKDRDHPGSSKGSDVSESHTEGTFSRETYQEDANLERPGRGTCMSPRKDSSHFNAGPSISPDDVTPVNASSDPTSSVGEAHAEMTVASSSKGKDASQEMLRGSVKKEMNPRVVEMANQMPDFQTAVIGEWDKHKQSDEYRLAEEEEWAARRQQIKIQQEEAQRLRKRKKAQTLRLLDMERRQKERVEEIRESQKRNEETIDLKDNLRAMIRKELEGLELKHRDMASLLRALGIHVRGGPYPLSSEINAAFKQALFRFHPDRASRTNIREQVEAEEKFKLISRLKQRLLPVPY